MISGFADEGGAVVFVVIALEVVARPPKMVLHDRCPMHLGAAACGIDLLGDVGGAWQEGAGGIVLLHDLRQKAAGQAVGIRVAQALRHRVTLVVARPQDDRRMIAKAADDRDGLLAQAAAKVLVLGIMGTRHRKILPDHHAVSVAKIEEGVILIHIAAPASEDIAAAVLHKGKRALIAPRIAGMEGIHRHPVRAAAHDLDPVDQKTEAPLLAGEGIGAVEHHLADAEGEGLLVHTFAADIEARDPVVNIRLAVSVGEPTFGIWDREMEIAVGEGDRLADVEAALPASALKLQFNFLFVYRPRKREIEGAGARRMEKQL